jgi:hypothetical protein
MNGWLRIFAATSPVDDLLPGKSQSQYVHPALKDSLILVGLAVVLGLLLLAWATFIRKRRRPGSSPSRRHTLPGIFENAARRHSRRKKRRRNRVREHRPRNPTLADTGGLPPPRDGDQWPT